MKKFLLLILLSVFLTGCVNFNTQYENITGTISSVDIVIEHDDDSSDKFLEIYVSGGNYRTPYTKYKEELLRINNEVTFEVIKRKRFPKYFDDFDVTEDNNSRMREILQNESKIIEENNK